MTLVIGCGRCERSSSSTEVSLYFILENFLLESFVRQLVGRWKDGRVELENELHPIQHMSICMGMLIFAVALLFHCKPSNTLAEHVGYLKPKLSVLRVFDILLQNV